MNIKQQNKHQRVRMKTRQSEAKAQAQAKHLWKIHQTMMLLMFGSEQGASETEDADLERLLDLSRTRGASSSDESSNRCFARACACACAFAFDCLVFMIW